MTLVSEFLRRTLDGDRGPAADGPLPGGGRWRSAGEGMLLCEPAEPSKRAADVVLSAGIHGNETAPIEICDALLRDIAFGGQRLGMRTLFLLGNLEAMRRGQRDVENDLNRLFIASTNQKAAQLRAERPDRDEWCRAAELEQAVRAFFASAPPAAHPVSRLHYDLHTAIRGSQIERFALYPYRADQRWLFADGSKGTLRPRARKRFTCSVEATRGGTMEWVINNGRDILAYLDDRFCGCLVNLLDDVVSEIDLADHPQFGSDWGAWFDKWFAEPERAKRIDDAVFTEAVLRYQG